MGKYTCDECGGDPCLLDDDFQDPPRNCPRLMRDAQWYTYNGSHTPFGKNLTEKEMSTLVAKYIKDNELFGRVIDYDKLDMELEGM
jgi:hypothetical protein